jgi:hypothetical protein
METTTKKKLFFNYLQLGLRWNFDPARAAENARYYVKTYKIPKTKIGPRKVLFHIRDILNFEQQHGQTVQHQLEQESA